VALKDTNGKALQQFDDDLYQLANPAIYAELSDWEKARLVTRVALKYGTLAVGTAEMANLAAKIGAAAAAKVQALVRGLAKDLEAGQVPKGGVPRPQPEGPPRVPEEPASSRAEC